MTQHLMYMRRILLILFGLGIGLASILAQGTVTNKTINGELMTIFVNEQGDTLLLADDLETVSITVPRSFKDRAERRKYYKYKRYALIVYPYAVKSIKIFRQVEHATATMSKRKRRKYIRKLQREYEKEFKKPLKNLTKTQGKILIKMIEKELDTDFYELLKGLRGGLNARTWQTVAKFNGYDLKEGYTEGDDPILDIVLKDLNISYEINE